MTNIIKTYEYHRRINGHLRLVAEVTKFVDGSAFVAYCNWSKHFEKADDAFISLNRSLSKIDSVNGWND